METSFITGKEINNNIEKENKIVNNTINNNQNLFDIKSVKNRRTETPDRSGIKDNYEQIFIRRLNFLKNLLNEDSRYANVNIQKNIYIDKINSMENKFYNDDKLLENINNKNITPNLKDRYKNI